MAHIMAILTLFFLMSPLYTSGTGDDNYDKEIFVPQLHSSDTVKARVIRGGQIHPTIIPDLPPPPTFTPVEENNTIRVPIGESVTVQENVEVTMDCVEVIDDLKHSGEANPIITWYKNGMKIRGNGTYINIMISADKRYCIIAATQLAVGGQLGTTGDYTCKVCSGNGTADCENKTSSQVVCGTPHIQLPVFSAIIFPTFIQLTCGQDVTVDSLQNVTIISFSCTVFNGSEPWTLSIYKDGKLTNYTVPFTISNPTDETYGTFTFVVSTQHCGSASVVSRLLQRGDPPDIDEGPLEHQSCIEGNKRVKIGTLVYGFDGYNVTIDCTTVSGTPPITITWLRNGMLIDTDVNTITITDAKDGDIIVCRADNNIGFDEEDTVIVQGKGITLAFTKPLYQVKENGGPAQPVLHLSGAVDCCSTISVWVNIKDMTAKNGKDKDYQVDSHKLLLFPGGATSTTLDIHIVDDVIVENHERFSVSIDPFTLPYDVSLGEISSAEVEILDDDRTNMSFDMGNYFVDEEDGTVQVTLKLTKRLPFNSTLQLITINETATNFDYDSGVHIIPIPIGETTITYNFTIFDDDLFEIDETFKLDIIESSLHKKVNRKEPSTATITIINNDEPINVTLTERKYTICETAGVLKVTLTLKKPSLRCFYVYIEAIDKTAEGGGVDYGEIGNGGRYKVIFSTGTNSSSIDIPIIDDLLFEQNKEFTIRIMEELLPFGITLGENTMTDVKIIDDDIPPVYLMFSSPTYEDYEHNGELCVTVTQDKPTFFNTTIEILQRRGTATSGRDYEEGPYNITIYEEQMSADYCINIINDEELEIDETFTITINNQTAVEQGVILMDPYVAKVTILDDEYTFCFEQRSYAVKEDDGIVSMKISLSRVLPFNISVKFSYSNHNANGNHSGNAVFDYYTTKTFPNFDIIPAYKRDYILNVTIVPDRILEDNELFHVTAVPQHLPAGQPECSVDVIIRDDDDITLEFENDSYIVGKNEEEKAVIVIEYPTEYVRKEKMPISIRVDEIDDTTTVGDYTRMNYTYYNITDGTERIILDLNPIDDNIVEADETYNLTIVVLYSSSHSRVIASETKKTTKIIIYDNDVAFLRFEEKFLKSSKSMEFPVNTTATIGITYKDDQHNTTTVTITRDQAIVWRLNPIPLPVFEVDVDKIVVNFPCKFKSMNLKRNNVQPTEKSVVPIEILYPCD